MNALPRSSTILLVTFCIVGLSVSCASVPKRNPLPMSLSESAVIEGIPFARYWADERPPFADEWFAKTREELADEAPAMFGQPHHYLAISGGEPKGAFGAGLLAGWSAAGTRPEFQVVTGISTGALTAPFAYLGSDYDHVIEEMYTQYSTDDLVDKRSPPGCPEFGRDRQHREARSAHRTLRRRRSSRRPWRRRLARDEISISAPQISTPSDRCSGGSMPLP